jgi:spore coat polysaccharide biosynthesis predicted glycosyltransferase SpsG
MFADNQAFNVRGFDRAGAVSYTGDIRQPGYSFGTLLERINGLMGDPGERKRLSERMKKMIDGRGAERIAAALKELL